MAVLLAVLTAWPGAAPAGPLDPEIDSAMEQDPAHAVPDPILTYSPRLKTLWLEALARPEADLKRLAADSIARGQRRGMAGMSETIPALKRELEAPDPHPVVRLAVARALLELDARETADVLRHHAQHDLEVALVAEPALARWNDQPARAMWLARLDDPRARRRELLLAIECLGTLREPRAAERLIELAASVSQPVDVRLTAARAVAAVRDHGLEATARRLSAERGPQRLIGRLVAASLLGGHSSASTRALLGELAVDAEPAVARIALARLLALDPALVVPLAPQALGRKDAHVRRLGAEALVSRPSTEHVALLAPLLDDVHPEVRRYVRRSFIELARQPALREPVIEAAVQALAGNHWRANEQAIFIVVALEHRAAIERLVELLEFRRPEVVVRPAQAVESARPEVLVTAGWALRRLDARDALDAILGSANRSSERFLSGAAADNPEVHEALGRQLAQLFELFGTARYGAADPLLRRFIPKSDERAVKTRATAIWALGRIHAGQTDAELTGLLLGRLSDLDPFYPEFDEVRAAAAVALGRMGAHEALPALRGFVGPDQVGSACRWAIHELTGEPLPELQPIVREQRGWFLTPLE
jgi:PBS lyase HEAT-like repeat